MDLIFCLGLLGVTAASKAVKKRAFDSCVLCLEVFIVNFPIKVHKMSGSKAEDLNKSKSTEPAIALKRIRTIMRSTADTGPINSEGLFVVSKATVSCQYMLKVSPSQRFFLCRSCS